MRYVRYWRVILLVLSGLANPSLAALDDYGAVVGTVVYDNIADSALTKSPHLEPQQTEGRYPHYIFYVDSPSGRYQCVIDIFSRRNTASDRESIRYRIVPLKSAGWASTLNLSNGYHQIPRDANNGALDYFRHPGINRDARTLAWKSDANFVVGTNLPAFDDLFRGVKRVWVFGEPYSNGLGIHNIHQNQGNVPNFVAQAPQGADGMDHSPANGLWQDGGVILEYAPKKEWIPPPLCKPKLPCVKKGRWILVPNRKLLMTQFQVQEDFTLDANTNVDGYNLKAGDGYPPLYLSDFRISSSSTTIPPSGVMEGQHSNVSGISKKIRILVTPTSGHPVLYGRIGLQPTRTQYNARSEQPVGGDVETIHSYSSSPQRWYWRVFNEGTTPATFTWEEFEGDL